MKARNIGLWSGGSFALYASSYTFLLLILSMNTGPPFDAAGWALPFLLAAAIAVPVLQIGYWKVSGRSPRKDILCLLTVIPLALVLSVIGYFGLAY
jgi:hypothetical protein